MHNTNRVRSICSLLLSVLIFFSALPTTVAAERPPAAYLAYGDSISSGYGLTNAASEGFTALVAVQNGYTLQNEAVAGYTSDDVYAQISGGAHDHAISQAAVITLTCGGNDLMGIRQEFLAVLGQGHLPANAIEQRRAHLLLQLLDLGADIGLGIPQIAPRLREIQHLGKLQKNIQLAYLHILHLCKSV